MAQAGLHGLAGLAVRRWTPEKRWLMLGIVLGNLAPDLDNVAVAAATLTGGSTEGLHRTFTHSLFTVAGIIVLGYLVAWLTKRRRWGNLGLGLGIGIVMHVLLDLLIWFNGVQILWPMPSWINLWGNVQPPEWWRQLMMPAEFLFFALFFWAFGRMARHSGTDAAFFGQTPFLDHCTGRVICPLYRVDFCHVIWLHDYLRRCLPAFALPSYWHHHSHA